MSKVIQTLIEYGKRQSFQPKWFSVFINPFFFIRKGLFKAIKENAVHLNGKMLDFGCGRKPYKNLFQVNEYIGLDMAQTGHSHELSEIDVYYDGKKIPFENNTFDSIFTSEVFEHIFNLDEILDELFRVLKKDGKILVTIPFMWGEHEQPYDYARYTSFAIKDLLEKKGFTIIKISQTGHAIEVIFQLYASYLFSLFQSPNKILNTIFTGLLISPFNIVGSLISLIFPKKKDLYHNNIILATK